MFTSATLAAARLSALENEACLKNAPTQASEDSFHGATLGKGRQERKQLGSSLVSVAALITKLDEEQPIQWESRSAPTLQLRPIRKPDEALRIFLKKVEAARINREEAEGDTAPVKEAFSDTVALSHRDSLAKPHKAELRAEREPEQNHDAQAETLDRIPAYEREIRRTAYSLLMKRAGSPKDFLIASDNRINAATNILTARAEAALTVERLLRRVEHGFTFHTAAWTLTTANTDNTPALFESCRSPQSVKVTVKNCQVYRSRNGQEPNNAETPVSVQEKKTETGIIPCIISGILEAAVRVNKAEAPANAMSAATTLL